MSTYTINGYLNNYGFAVKKNKIDSKIFKILVNYFTVKPELNYENEKIDEEKKFLKYFIKMINI